MDVDIHNQLPLIRFEIPAVILIEMIVNIIRRILSSLMINWIFTL